ncbi:hypothetical protein TOPH_08581 [Tolypocladium ophioglossoides CBS 100239]|uniref:Protein kinase domain-containing protein n=1 Tax=Tolypocladium ophioglossoides (strain CBS 100239) TaxID=1163406 RepID=A0A0L0MYB7_TOLOC|nr:hypothetical protein TOPH_08581 [Tolypocladium ophioglossoides CBS 100239]
MEVSPNEPFQILYCNSVWKDKNGDPTFDHRMVVLRHSEQYFFGRDSRRKGDIDPALLSLEPIPITHIRAPFTADLTMAPDLTLDLEDVYIKEPGLVAYGHCSPAEQQAFFKPQLQEAQVYEQLRLKPHPNIGIYHGCVVKGGRIKGLCLRRYGRTLGQLLREETLGQDQKTAYMEDVKKGVVHLHALGFVHGDINPSNIMLDSRINQAVLIDFDSCRPVGKPMGRKAGTTDWSSVDCPEVAEMEHDYTALQLIQRLLEDS